MQGNMQTRTQNVAPVKFKLFVNARNSGWINTNIVTKITARFHLLLCGLDKIFHAANDPTGSIGGSPGTQVTPRPPTFVCGMFMPFWLF